MSIFEYKPGRSKYDKGFIKSGIAQRKSAKKDWLLSLMS